MHPFRTHTCGEIRKDHVGESVRLSGWVHRKRDHGGVLFLDLRDHYGVTQVIIAPDKEFFDRAEHLRLESVVTVTGNVVARTPETINPDIATGEVELECQDFHVESEADSLPFPVNQELEYPEDIRLQNRFLDLRKDRLHANILLRSKVAQLTRKHMTERGFTEYHTPILTSSSPEGARDYLVPSRIYPGHFYALPQAPQQFKQLLMVAGFDRYFQIAPCFRDEDSRADRSPGEFYQIDVEMSFVTQEDLFHEIELLIVRLFRELSNKEINAEVFPHIPYRESMEKYGSDKPDLRFGLELVDVTDIFSKCDLKVFSSAVETGGAVKVIRAEGAAEAPRKFFDDAEKFAKNEGAKGLAWIALREGEWKGPIVKFLSEEEKENLAERSGAVEGDALFFGAGDRAATNGLLGKVRNYLGNALGLIDRNKAHFCWIVDFPMFEYNEEEKKIDFSHNPFSMPNYPIDDFLALDPADHAKILDILAIQYDVVCNGVELSSGAIRNHRPDVMKKAFAIAGYGEDVLAAKFGGMLRALSLGAPPHGGIAPGIDRIVMLLCGEENLREVVLFPMNQKAEDLLMGAPSEVTPKQLRELHIRLALPEKS